MAAARHVEQHARAGIVEHRRDDGDVGQMRAAVVGRVEHVDVARPQLGPRSRMIGLDRAVHGAEVHRHVRRVGDERARGVEHGAGEVEPLLDVHRLRGVAQRFAHLLGDRHEQVVEHLEQHRVGGGAETLALRAATARVRTMSLRAVSASFQPGSTTMVWCGSMTSAGPASAAPGTSASRSTTGASCHAPRE